jgi:hypothetical protein
MIHTIPSRRLHARAGTRAVASRAMARSSTHEMRLARATPLTAKSDRSGPLGSSRLLGADFEHAVSARRISEHRHLLTPRALAPIGLHGKRGTPPSDTSDRSRLPLAALHTERGTPLTARSDRSGRAGHVVSAGEVPRCAFVSQVRAAVHAERGTPRSAKTDRSRPSGATSPLPTEPDHLTVRSESTGGAA